MDVNVSKKAAKRKRQRLSRKGNLKNLETEKITSEITAVVVKKPIEEIESKMNKSPEKSKEEILVERQAKKAAKQSKKSEGGEKQNEKSEKRSLSSATPDSSPLKPETPQESKISGKSKDQILAERAAKNLAKQAAKKNIDVASPDESKAKTPKDQLTSDLVEKVEKLQIDDSGETPGKKVLSKAERRAIQEAQRSAKARVIDEKNTTAKKIKEMPAKRLQDVTSKKLFETPLKLSTNKPSVAHKVKLFKHLYADKCDFNINVNQKLHPAIVKLGLQYANDTVVGSNARCYAFLNAMKTLINDYVTPPEKLFCRGLEAELVPAMAFLQNCRPFAVSMTNALKYIKLLVSQEDSGDNDDDKKRRLVEKINIYATEQIETAAIAISLKVREKISNGDVILTYGCSSLIKRTLIDACRDSAIKFRVIIVDSRPDHEGREMLKSLAMLGINCVYVLINAVGFVMPEVTKVLLGAHALLANGYVMSRVGTAQIALVAKSYNVPVLVCCETHKFSERVQTDAFVFNEIGDPSALVMNKNTREKSEFLKDWESIPHLTPLNLRYDITPPELVTAVVTEVAILPCTSVQVILRVKPAE